MLKQLRRILYTMIQRGKYRQAETLLDWWCRRVSGFKDEFTDSSLSSKKSRSPNLITFVVFLIYQKLILACHFCDM